MNNWCDLYPEWGVDSDTSIGNYKDRIEDLRKRHPEQFREDGSFRGRIKPSIEEAKLQEVQPLNFIQKVKKFLNI